MLKTVWLSTLLAVLLAPAVTWAGPTDMPTPDRAYVDAVIEAMVEAGLLSREQADAVKAQGAQAAQVVAEEMAVRAAAAPPPPKQWYDNIRVSGYGQVRWLYYPEAAEGAKSNEFLLRRARFTLDARPHPLYQIYIQPDMGEGSFELRDYWIERALDDGKETRLRLGQQKVPFGFESPQSSSRRLPLERNWLARRMIPGERDTGITLYYTNADDKRLFSHGSRHEFGTGDYGNFALGVYNGQGINTAEVNSSKHIVARGAKPFMLNMGGNDVYAEAGASLMTGKYHSSRDNRDYDDRLLGIHAYLSPHPVGIQAEYYTGKTEGGDVDGWYAMLIARTDPKGVAFLRYDEYNGPRKGRGEGNVYDRDRWSIGYCHQLDARSRLTVEYDKHSDSGKSDDMFGIQIMTSF